MTKIICPPNTLYHCLTHLAELDPSARRVLKSAGFSDDRIDEQLEKPGSKFYPDFAKSVSDVIDRISGARPDLFLDDTCIPCDGEMKACISVVFPFPIGTKGVVHISELSKEELSTMTTELRNGLVVRKVYVDSLSETDECQLIMRKDRDSWRVLTVYPGEFAPPLPRNGESDPYWDEHCFIEERREA